MDETVQFCAPRPTVLHVSATSWVVGNQVLPIARRLLELGWTVEVACPAGPEVEELSREGLAHRHVPFARRIFSPAHVLTLARLVILLRRNRYTAVHLHGPFPGILGRIAAAFTRTPAIYHCRGTLYDGESHSALERFKVRMYEVAERLNSRWTFWTFVLNRADRSDLIHKAGIPADRITHMGVGGCGLDLSRWRIERFTSEELDAVRETYGIPAGSTVVGFVGRVVREKGILELIDAFNVLRSEGRRVHLLVVGGVLSSERDQRTQHEARERVSAAGNDAFVTFTGDVQVPEALIAVMDVLCLPSYREGFGQVIAEAGALAKPVVAADSRGARDAIVDGVTGLLVPRQDSVSLTAAVRVLLDDSSLREEIGAAACERARRELSREAFMEKVLGVYTKLPADENRLGLDARLRPVYDSESRSPTTTR